MRRCSARRDPRGLTSVGLSGDVGGRLAVGLCGLLLSAVRRVVVFVLSLNINLFIDSSMLACKEKDVQL